MRWLVRLGSGLFLGVFSLALVGCPPGAGLGGGQDGGGDADAGEGGDTSSDAQDEDDDDSDSDTGPIDNGSGALCGVNGRNDCGAFLLCDQGLGCVECLADSDCPAAAARCFGGTCVAPCTGASDCAAGSTCDADAGICARCSVDGLTEDGICPSAKSECSPLTRKCVQCVDNDNCHSDNPRCRVLVGQCVACLANEDCGHAAPICDPLTFECREGCTSDLQCPGQTCDLTVAQCVAIPIDASVPVDASSDGDD